jgi:muramoyltetrapeptide carboxypeptidase
MRRKNNYPGEIIKPPGLKKGDRIGIISPAGPVDPSLLERGIEIITSFGYEIALGTHVYQRQAYLAGEDAARLADLHQMFLDKTVRAVFCSRGGYGSSRLLDQIDYSLIRENPKILVGYSDITALLIAIHTMTGLVTFHGPMVGSLSRSRLHELERLFALLSGGSGIHYGLEHAHVLVSGRAKGRLLGGNLSLICHLLGTRYFPDFSEGILFLEEKGEPLYRIDRMLSQLAMCGVFSRVSGLLTGHFHKCDEKGAIELILKANESASKTPLVTGLPFGHGPRNMPIPLGLHVELDTSLMTLSLVEPCVRA